VHTEQPTAVATEGQQRHRDPQNFTRGDILAWKVVAYTGAGVTIAGMTAGIIALVAIVTA